MGSGLFNFMFGLGGAGLLLGIIVYWVLRWTDRKRTYPITVFYRSMLVGTVLGLGAGFVAMQFGIH